MVDIRRVSPADWLILRSVRLAALDEAPDAFGSTYEREYAFTEQHWLGRIKRSAWFVAWENDEPAGLVGGYVPNHPPDAREGILMWVEPAPRGRGKGADRPLPPTMGRARDVGAAPVSAWGGPGQQRAR